MKKMLIFTILSISAITSLSACDTQSDNIDNATIPTQNLESTVNTTDTETTPKVTNVETPSLTTEKAVYKDYSEELYNSLIGQKPFALFFHASWCPTCKQMEEAINADLSSTNPTLADGTIILKADYDSETKLKQKYGILSQSTVVIINAQGEAITTLAAPTVTEINEAITSTL